MKNTDYGIILNKISYSETSLIVAIYTKNNGLQKFIFQGGKKKNSILNPLTIVEITFYKRPDSELGKLSQVELIQKDYSISFDPLHSIISFFITEIILKCLKSNDQDESLFDFFSTFIESIHSNDDNSNTPIYFLTSFSKHLGFQPNNLVSNPTYFNLIEGEMTDLKPTGDLYITGNPLRLIHQLFQHNLPMNFTKPERQQALQTMLTYYKIHVPNFGILNSLTVIQELLYD